MVRSAVLRSYALHALDLESNHMARMLEQSCLRYFCMKQELISNRTHSKFYTMIRPNMFHLLTFVQY